MDSHELANIILNSPKFNIGLPKNLKKHRPTAVCEYIEFETHSMYNQVETYYLSIWIKDKVSEEEYQAYVKECEKQKDGG